MRVDLTAIHNLMLKFYGSREMNMYTFAERKHFIKPKEIKLIFDYKEDCNLEIERLTRRLSCLVSNKTLFIKFIVQSTLKWLVVCAP